MTVASLWKALDRAGCGQAIGTAQLKDPTKKTTTPWNFNENKSSNTSKHLALAIDLSIWICESLTSTAICENHSDPTLHLVYTRALKLLNLGMKLVAVVEGKRRIRRSDGEEDRYHKRRSGTQFWRACQRCEELLRLLGIPVVRATAEGEALCALLNQRGIVDGIISNDGDCLLFGAKVLYKNFSIENLENDKVMRYDASDIKAIIDDDDSDEYDLKATGGTDAQPSDIVKLGRSDLVVFAILTGSDIAGNGLPHVGCRKALRFIRKCQIDNPCKPESAGIEELKSWARAAAHKPTDDSGQRCSCCLHAGTKRSHLKHGCQQCGTEPGEPCFQMSPGGKFRKALRAKALEMDPKFDPEGVHDTYYQPNNNQVPMEFAGVTACSMEMAAPDLPGLLRMPHIIRGRSHAESREYMQQSVSKLLARTEIMCQVTSKAGNTPKKLPPNKNRPQPQKINKAMSRGGIGCFEVEWAVKASMTDADGKPIDEFHFSTTEEQAVFKKCYPTLVDSFQEEERERTKQGDTEKERRRTFLESMWQKPHNDSDKSKRRSGAGLRGNGDLFACNVSKPVQHTARDAPPSHIVCRQPEAKGTASGDDVNQLLRFVSHPSKNDTVDSSSLSSYSSDSDSLPSLDPSCEEIPCTPGHLHFLGNKPKELTPCIEKQAERTKKWISELEQKRGIPAEAVSVDHQGGTNLQRSCEHYVGHDLKRHKHASNESHESGQNLPAPGIFFSNPIQNANQVRSSTVGIEYLGKGDEMSYTGEEQLKSTKEQSRELEHKIDKRREDDVPMQTNCNLASTDPHRVEKHGASGLERHDFVSNEHGLRGHQPAREHLCSRPANKSYQVSTFPRAYEGLSNRQESASSIMDQRKGTIKRNGGHIPAMDARYDYHVDTGNPSRTTNQYECSDLKRPRREWEEGHWLEHCPPYPEMSRRAHSYIEDCRVPKEGATYRKSRCDSTETWCYSQYKPGRPRRHTCQADPERPQHATSLVGKPLCRCCCSGRKCGERTYILTKAWSRHDQESCDPGRSSKRHPCLDLRRSSRSSNESIGCCDFARETKMNWTDCLHEYKEKAWEDSSLNSGKHLSLETEAAFELRHPIDAKDFRNGRITAKIPRCDDHIFSRENKHKCGTSNTAVGSLCPMFGDVDTGNTEGHWGDVGRNWKENLASSDITTLPATQQPQNSQRRVVSYDSQDEEEFANREETEETFQMRGNRMHFATAKDRCESNEGSILDVAMAKLAKKTRMAQIEIECSNCLKAPRWGK